MNGGSGSAPLLGDTTALLRSLDALRNLPALALLAATMCLAACLVASATLLPTFAAIVLVLLALAAVYYGVHAAGILMMDETRHRPARSVGAALRAALTGGHRWLGVLLLVAAVYAAGLVAMGLVLVMCRLPVVGPALFAVVLPVAVLVAGAALMALPLLVLPLTGPASWEGGDAAQSVARLWRHVRVRPVQVLVPMAGVGCVALLAGGLSFLLVFLGAGVVASLSWTLLGVPALVASASLPAASPQAMLATGYASAGFVGGALAWAAASAVPLLVLLRGACVVYRDRVELAGVAQMVTEPADLTTIPATLRPEPGILSTAAPVPSSLATTVTMMRTPVPEAPPAGVDFDLPLEVPPSGQPAPAAPVVLRCHACAFRVQRDDRFCGSCGALLPAQPAP